jgi:NhaP-type Na+/H+ or K+/H+ antiporter
LPFAADALPWYALLLLVAAIAGELVLRWLHLPRLFGWIATGILLGPQIGGVLTEHMLGEMRGVLDVAIGVVLFQLGPARRSRLAAAQSRRCSRPACSRASLAFAAMFAVLLLIEVQPLLAALAAAIGIATGPAVVLSLTRELRAQGQVTERMLLLTSLNCVYAFVRVNILLAWMHQEYSNDWLSIFGHPLYLIFGSLVLALVFALATLVLLTLLGRRAEAQFIAVVALVVTAVYAASALKLSIVLVLLGYGVMARAFDTSGASRRSRSAASARSCSCSSSRSPRQHSTSISFPRALCGCGARRRALRRQDR